MDSDKIHEYAMAIQKVWDAKPKKEPIAKNIKCNCGHTAKYHFKGGWCSECACTWFYPNDKWILRNNKRKK